MRILFINYEFPPLGGGAGKAMASIAREIARRGHEVHVLTSRFGAHLDSETIDGYIVTRIRTPRREIDRSNPAELLAFMLAAIPRALQEGFIHHPDITIAFFGIPSGPAALLLRLVLGIPYIVSLRGLDVPGFRLASHLVIYNRLMKVPIRFIWRGAAAVVTNSNGLRKLAHRTDPSQDITVIPNGINLTQFTPRDDGSTPHKFPYLLFVGRLVRQKGLQYLFEALQMVSSPYHLTIVGDGSERPALERMAAEMKIDKQISFCGWQDHGRLLPYYHDADIFVLPSEGEGMPNVLLEAMACGLPIIATRVAGSEDLVESGRNGLLVPASDSAALAGALKILLQDDTRRRKMGKQSLERAREYSWEACADRYLDLAQTILTSKD